MLCQKNLNYGSLKRHFLHFEGTLEQNIKVLNDIFLQRIHLIVLSYYFSPNEIDFHFEFYFILTLGLRKH